MGCMPGRWRIAIIVLVALLATMMAYRGATAAADLMYEGPFDVGGTIRLTLSADQSGVTSFNLKDVPFFKHGGCGLYPASTSAYYDPPLPIVDEAFELRIGYGDPHHSGGYTVRGSVLSDSVAHGVAQAAKFNAGGGCNTTSDELEWNAEGPVADDHHAGEMRFVGDVAGGQITVVTNQARTQLLALLLGNVHLPCEASPALNVAASFDPPIELRLPENLFRVDLTVYRGDARELLSSLISNPAPDLVGGYFTGGGSSCDPPSPKTIWWTASLADDELAAPLPATAVAPAPPSGLPKTGQVHDSHRPGVWLLVLGLMASSAILIPLGLRGHGR